jgi:hypothetical protein
MGSEDSQVQSEICESFYGKKPPNTACTRRVGVAAFSGSLRSLKLVPAKWRSLVPPTRG